jgi:endonuclease YncB( thermonuclease family)
MDSKFAFLISLLLTLLITFNFYFFKTSDKTNTVQIERVIDGDTVVTSGGTTLRLVNINTPEKNEIGYQEAKDYLKTLENRTVEIEVLGIDKYKRTLVKIFAPDYINLEIVKQGLGKKFLVQQNELKQFKESEESAIENSRGLWQKSSSYGCFTSQIDFKREFVHLENSCPEINLNNWILSDESRKRYKFPDISLGAININTFSGEDNLTDLYWNLNQDVWNNDRDTLYLVDSAGKIVHYNSYGYAFITVFSSIFSS